MSTLSSRVKPDSARAPACARRACTSRPSGVLSGASNARDGVRWTLAGRLAQPATRIRSASSRRNQPARAASGRGSGIARMAQPL
jgi:hypothetical protein